MDLEQRHQIEKVAGALATGNVMKGIYNAGKWLTYKPLDWTARFTKTVASPFAWAAGKAGQGLGKVTGKAIEGTTNKVLAPTINTVGKGLAGTAGALGAAATGTAAGIGQAGVKHIGAPAVKWLGQRFKDAPFMSTAVTGVGALGVRDAIKSGASRPFTTGPQARKAYDLTKRKFRKVGMDMTNANIEKTASILSAAKKVINYGGVGPSVLGYGALAALPVMAAPTLQGIGDTMKRTVFPLESRINAEEEVAKKQLDMATHYQMSQDLHSSSVFDRQQSDAPILEEHLNYLVHNDPVINDFALQDPNKFDEIRETLYTVHNFAPDIATNRQAAQSILREAVTTPDGGLNYNTVKLIADAQKAIGQNQGSSLAKY